MINIQWDNHNRIELLQFLTDKKGYKTYLEIGCDKNQVFDKINVEFKIGVDPNRGGTLRMTSDAFFAQDDRSWDLIFIDGLHEYLQVKRDVDNALSRLNTGGSIVVHDMLPVRQSQAGAKPEEKYWLGDVWFLGFDLMKRSDIRFNIFNFDFGCGIVTRGQQEPAVLDAVNNWKFYQENYSKLPIITFEDYFNA